MYNVAIDSISLSSGEYPEVTGHLVYNSANTNTTNIYQPDHNYLKTWDTITIGDSPSRTITDGWYTGTGTVIIPGDLTIGGKINLPKNSSIDKIEIDEEDIIMLTFDPDQYDIATCQQILEMWSNNFPNHKVIGTFKGVKIDLIKDRGRKNKEVTW